MGKRTNEPSDKDDTRVLYKKSISSIHTHSRTFSGQSQTFTRSGIIHVKKNISEANTYYFNSGKDKKDLSIETDVCILRRYYKNKLNKLACQKGLSTNRSVKDAEIKTSSIEQKFEAGDSADNLKNVDVVSLIVENFKDLLNKWIREYILNNENLQKMETVRDSLMHRLELNSLKENPSNWTFVQNCKNKCRKKRFNKIKKKKKHFTKRKGKPKAVVKCSCYTIPFQCKNVRIISTLSIPRNFDKSALMNKDSNGQLIYRINKVSRKNIFVSLKKPEDLYVDSSTFNLLAISSRSFTKRCVTYNDKSKKRETTKRNNASEPKRRNKLPTESTISMETETNSIQRPEFLTDTGFDPLPSRIKNIYGDISPKTNTSYFFQKNDNFTMTDHVSSRIVNNTVPGSSESNECTDFKNNKNSGFSSEKDCSDPVVTFGFLGSGIEFPPLDSSKLKNNLKNISKRSPHRNNRDAKKRNIARLKKYTENNSNLSSVKDFTYLYNKVNKKLTDDSEFLGHFQDIFKYIAGRDRQNVRLDVHVNVYPFADYTAKPENDVTEICDNQASYSVTYNSNRRNLDTLIECQETEPCSSKESKGSKNIDSPEIITLLDGAASQGKYIIMSENLSENAVEDTKNKICSNVSDITKVSGHTKVSEDTQVSEHTVSDNTQVSGHTIVSDNTKLTECYAITKVEITNEINELKNVIQSLAVTTEKLINEQIKGKKKKVQQKSQGETTIMYNYTVAGTTTEKSETHTTPNEIQTNQSKGVNVTQNMLKNDDFSDLKLKIDPKRPEVGEIYTRLTEKSTTYHIIDSESVLKITDMTSHANNVHGPGPNEVGLTCSIPDSESYFETPVGKENNLLTFFCEGCSRRYRPLSDAPSRRSNLVQSELGESLSCRGCGVQLLERMVGLSTEMPMPTGLADMLNQNDSAGSYIDFGVQCYQMFPKRDGDTRMEDDCCKVLPRRRNFGCYEGLAYCVLVLMIPFLFLSALFFFLVVQKGYLNRNLLLKHTRDLAGYKASDLGF